MHSYHLISLLFTPSDHLLEEEVLRNVQSQGEDYDKSYAAYKNHQAFRSKGNQNEYGRKQIKNGTSAYSVM